MKKYIVHRRDISSNEVMNRELMFKIVFVENRPVFDKDMTIKRRSIYIKKDISSINNALKKKIFKRSDSKDIDKLKEELLSQLK